MRLRPQVRACYAEYYHDRSDAELLHLLATVPDEQLDHLSRATDASVNELRTFRNRQL